MLNSITTAQECDARDDDSSNAADYIKKLSPLKRINQMF